MPFLPIRAIGMAVVSVAVVAGVTLAPTAAAAGPADDLPVLPPSEGRAAPAAAAQSGESLVGTFRLTEGKCTASGASGTWFRMTQPAGSPITNNDSPCSDKSYTILAPGRDGGLKTGEYQAHPQPAFSSSGGGLNDRITKPAGFYGVNFSTATNQTDPQTNTQVVAPSVVHDGAGKLSGDLRAFAAAWNGQHFNQGSPKPDGSRPTGTSGPTGTYDAGTGAFTLQWSSLIQGGPFNGFTGTWHFEGTFSPAAGRQASAGSSGTSAPAPAAAPPATSSSRPVRAGVAGATTGPLPARTGPPFELAVSVMLFALGVTGLVVARRARPLRA